MSRLFFNARCTRSRHPQVLMVGKVDPDSHGERYYSLEPEEAVRLSGELLEAARQAYRLSSDADNRQGTRETVAPVTARADVCRHQPDNCPLPVCLCQPYPISSERVQLLCDLRKLAAPFQFRGFWVATVSDVDTEQPTAAGSPPEARPAPTAQAGGR